MSKPEPIRHVVVVSDTHCGGSTALMPPEFVTIEEQTVQANAMQLWYWDVWCELWDHWVPKRTRGEPFMVVFNGDCVEGLHHHTKEVVSAELGDHIEIAKACYAKPMAIASACAFVEGTEVHVGNVEHGLASHFGAIGPNGSNKAWRRFDAMIAGNRCIIQHHISTSARTWTESTGPGAALANERLEAAGDGEIPPNVLLSAHRHRPGLWLTPSGISGVTGAWQALTRHGRKVVPSARCRPSAILMSFDEEGQLPDTRQFSRCPPPAPQITL